MKIGFPECKSKMILYALVAITIWFLILTVIPMSFSQTSQETTQPATGESQQAPEKTSIFKLIFKDAGKGLYIMYVLLFGAVALIFTIPERAAFFWNLSRPKKGKVKVQSGSDSEGQSEDYYTKKIFFEHLDVNAFSAKIKDKLSAGDLDSAIEMCENENHPIASVFVAGINTGGNEASQKYSSSGKIDEAALEKIKEEIDKSIEVEGNNQVGRLEQRLWIIDAVATLAPMFGFLGTIVGLIGAFMGWGAASEAGEQVGIGTLAGGMYQAMFTTAGGLIIGIPAAFTNILINNRIKELTLMMSEHGNEILKTLVSSIKP